MGKQEDAKLILKLYELRRETVMREARNWFFTFNPTSVQDFVGVMMGEHSGHYRMVVSYWDMAASMVNQGAIDEELFNASGGEISGFGLAKAKITGMFAMLLTISGFNTPPADRPRKISAS